MTASLPVFLLACFGTTNVLSGGAIFARPRAWLEGRSKVLGYWARCPMCLGLWVGVAWALAGLWPRVGLAWPLEGLAAGVVSSGVCWVARVVLAHLGEDDL